jgi:hypothetical protein
MAQRALHSSTHADIFQFIHDDQNNDDQRSTNKSFSLATPRREGGSVAARHISLAPEKPLAFVYNSHASHTPGLLLL